MKKIFSVFLAIVMVFSMTTMAFAADFKDTADSKHYDAIETLHALGLVSGYNKDTYGPNDELTRAQACAIIIRALNGEPRDYYNQIFTDVPVTHWAADYIAEAYNMGLMGGYGDGIFGPDDKITYDQMSKVILNMLGYRNTGSWPEGLRSTAKMAGLYDNCVIIDGATPCTRGVVAQMIYNAFDCKTLNNSGFPTGETFMESLGIKQIADTWQKDEDGKFTGHMVMTYKIGKDTIPTSVITTYSKSAEYISDTALKIGNKTVNVKWADVELFVDGKDATAYPADIKNMEVIYNADDEMIAVVATTPVKVTTYVPGSHDFTKDEIKAMDNYIEGISTVTKIGDEFKVSNKYYVGFVADAWSNTNTYFVEFTDGTIMKFDDASAWNLNGGELAIVFYDYLGNPVGAAQGVFVDYSK